MAHIPDGFLSPPVLAGTAVATAGVLAVAGRRARAALGERQAPVLGALTAFVFAAQMFNFPLGAGTSAHLLGGVLVAVVAGPWAGMLVLFSVVLVQALLFQDGGVAALGANALNLAVLGAGGGWLLYRWIHVLLGAGERWRLVAAALAAYLTAVLTGVAVALELALSGVVPLRAALLVVGGSHLLVGAGEAVLTTAILSAVLRGRPELVATPAGVPASRRRAVLVGTLAVGVALAAAAFASGRPDALEAAAARLGLAESASLLAAPFRDYMAPVGGAWVAGVVGVAVVFLVAWLLLRATARAAPPS